MSDARAHTRAELEALWSLFFGPNGRTPHGETPAIEYVLRLEDLTTSLHRMLTLATVLARLEGETWQRIGEARGMSRQAAARYRELVQLTEDQWSRPHMDGEEELPLEP